VVMLNIVGRRRSAVMVVVAMAAVVIAVGVG